ncbi:glutamate synthase domain-containing 3 [Weissella koreensis KACC 15510]|uniref:sugar phosphate isomerase/epimerase family protein n=1 Tax=Weissella koreensis TaxID=165096 RepID=UPI0002174E84|nr:TIM barrel protein [Weissella koreensis]AEJ23317.1 glutamate synthase domain-containing 3 [Weissella koreensis KACC 15510]
MINSKIVLNNLVFAQQKDAGMSQLEMLKIVQKLKVTSAELRREYFDNIEEEILPILKFMKNVPLRLFYSVPDALFVHGELNSKLDQYFEEAKQLNIYAIKFNIGDFQGLTGAIITKLTNLIDTGIQINVENDQTQESGRLNVMRKFMQVVTDAGLSIGYVYDMGNWRFVGEDELKAAQSLAKYVRYIHVKDGQGFESSARTLLLGKGEIDWKNILMILPHDVPVALEYPTPDIAAIENGIDMLNDYLGDR